MITHLGLQIRINHTWGQSVVQWKTEMNELPSFVANMLQTFYSCLVNNVFSQGENLFEELPGGKKIVLGVCAMQKKSNSKPMHEILGRLEKFMQMQTMIFDEDVILNKPIEEWPIVDVLISFFSAGFPLDKAIEYTKLRQPFVINDLESQYTLLDRWLFG